MWRRACVLLGLQCWAVVNCKNGEQLVEKNKIGGSWIQIIVYLHVGSLCGWCVVLCSVFLFALPCFLVLDCVQWILLLLLYSFVACL
jgi:hypothetical protein